MRGTTIALLGALGLVVAAGVYGVVQRDNKAVVGAQAGLANFQSEDALRRYLEAARPKPQPSMGAGPGSPQPTGAPSPQVEQSAAPTPESPAPADESITNTQEAGVDEGGIVKNRGDLLVILRRGRLFTVSTAGGGMKPIDHINAFPPGATGSGAWYDEMLLAGDRVIVIGYSFESGGTEVNRFRLAADGKLTFEDAYALRGSDYYSSRNYASRLIGTTLVLYNAIEVPERGDPLKALPAMRSWDGKPPKAGEDFGAIVGAAQVYVPPRMSSPGVGHIDTIHSVSRCDLAAPKMTCKATAVLGARSRVFYVSPTAVYLWVADAWQRAEAPQDSAAMLYRMPLDGAPPTAVGVRGSPTDQFSFREEGGKTLNVLVRSSGSGDGMWKSATGSGSVALLNLPIDGFGGGDVEAAPAAYRDLPQVGSGAAMQNRFVGRHVLYGYGAGWGERGLGGNILVAASLDGGEPALFNLPHPVDRIEVLGADALVVGSDQQALTFTAVTLPASGPATLGDRYVLQGAAEGETRSHAFFYKPDAGSDGASGVLGLPFARRATAGYEQLFRTSAGLLFLRRDAGKFAPLGDLTGTPVRGDGEDDGCVASCTDWYGNARPIFLGGRTYALLGYELVEGRVQDGRMTEVGRVGFAPPARPRPG